MVYPANTKRYKDILGTSKTSFGRSKDDLVKLCVSRVYTCHFALSCRGSNIKQKELSICVHGFLLFLSGYTTNGYIRHEGGT